MATLALAAAGSMLGGAMLPGGISLLGATLSGAAIGQAAGALAGRYVDQALFGSSGQSRQVEGSRLSDLQVIASTEGSVIPRLYGRARMAGQIIWATQLEEEIIKTKQSAGGGKGRGPSVTTTQYNYYANFAVGLCEGEISRIGTIWADGKPLALKDLVYRVYHGNESQQPDSLILAKEGAGKAPAYRGLSYIVFEHLALEKFGNRIPQLNFEVFRPVDLFEKNIRAVTMLPGSGEFVYDKAEIFRDEGYGVTTAENIHTVQGGSDWTVSLNDLQDSLPNTKAVSLIVSWFGSDLRAGQCSLQPKVDSKIKKIKSGQWSVAGLTRDTASRVSLHENEAAYGGTPNDEGVISAIRDLKERGIQTVFNPFILMDIPTDNNLPDPYGGNGQGAYPWRGLITCDPAPDQNDTVDKTAFIPVQTDHFMGTASPSDFSIANGSVVYSGSQEWSYRRMILHYAFLCKLAGGVDAFLLGSELRGLSTLRDENNHFPFVDALIALAADVRSILGADVKITYGADWSEYFGHQPSDGSGDVWFHLDPLWADPNIDVIGIDCYWPLSDWRDGEDHLDFQQGTDSLYDLDYLRGNMAGGEGYDFYYASASDRDNQIRTPITDGGGKPWLFRYKDIRGWWQNLHYNRVAGVEQTQPTAWIPESKPFWFTEIGCGAVDKGANQPNIFYDPKSVQSGRPHYSRGIRDDFIQRQYLQAFLGYFDRNAEDYQGNANPLSALTGLPMVDQDYIFVYSWDARPYPAFPFDAESWGDGGNWQSGHWLNGRIGDAPLEATVRAICQDYGVENFEASGLEGLMSGLVVNNLQTVRSVLQPLELAFFFDSYESGKNIIFRQRREVQTALNLNIDDLVEVKAGSELFRISRSQETELPAVARISYIDNGFNYQQATTQSRRIAGGSAHVAVANLPLIVSQQKAADIALNWLAESWGAREKASFSLPPSKMALEASDRIEISLSGHERVMRVVELTDQHSLEITAQSLEASAFEAVQTSDRPEAWSASVLYGQAAGFFMDLPLLDVNDDPYAGYIAAYQSPWSGRLAFYRSAETSGYQIDSFVTAPATLGQTQTDLVSGISHRRDFSAFLDVIVEEGQLTSVSSQAMYSGANEAALRHENGDWEIIQFQSAELLGEGHYRLSVLLRGQKGTEHLAGRLLPAASVFILLDEAIAQTGLSLDERGLPLNWKYGPSSENISASSFTGAVYRHDAIALRPFAPVHPKLKRVGSGYELEWIRRSRFGGDGWENSDIILGEQREAYEVDILGQENLEQGLVVKTLSSQRPSLFYSDQDITGDFGTLPNSLTFRIYQISDVYGRGLALTSSFTL